MVNFREVAAGVPSMIDQSEDVPKPHDRRRVWRSHDPAFGVGANRSISRVT